MSHDLLIDAGNTRLKWAHATAPERFEHALWEAFAAFEAGLQDTGTVWIASVAGAERDALLRRRFPDARWLASEAVAFGVENAYAEPARLGVDRWMALLAARARAPVASLVVSAGTALTVDALDARGRFLGGTITPGAALMRAALASGTAAAGAAPGRLAAFPRTTADAVETGVWNALAGAVAAQYRRLAAHAGQAPHCLIGGGDAQSLARHLDIPCELAPALVLEGMAVCVRGKETG